jgi:hypothetical protein
MLGLIAVGVADKWPNLKVGFHYIIHPPGPLATLYVFVLVVVFAYAYPELRARYPWGLGGGMGGNYIPVGKITQSGKAMSR